MHTLLQEDQSYARLTLGTNQHQPLDGQKVLGLCWNTSGVQFIFDVSHLGRDANLEPKKRDIVGLTSRIYDQMGVISPVIIRFKVLLQGICESKIGWDDYMSGDLLKQ